MVLLFCLVSFLALFASLVEFNECDLILIFYMVCAGVCVCVFLCAKHVEQLLSIIFWNGSTQFDYENFVDQCHSTNILILAIVRRTTLHAKEIILNNFRKSLYLRGDLVSVMFDWCFCIQDFRHWIRLHVLCNKHILLHLKIVRWLPNANYD